MTTTASIRYELMTTAGLRFSSRPATTGAQLSRFARWNGSEWTAKTAAEESNAR
ncbi:Uncharacterised protein [Burkholderia oklahomensis]|nr:Uncharacterised protein [Burkholderia oklahomensis]